MKKERQQANVEKIEPLSEQDQSVEKILTTAQEEERSGQELAQNEIFQSQDLNLEVDGNKAVQLKAENSSEENSSKDEQTNKGNENIVLSKKQQFLQFLKFLAFSLSAGVIQLVSFELLYNWTDALAWWPAYLISIILSVIWNFTFNRKFTFKAASNVPIAMTLVIIYYAMFIPVSTFGGDALEAIGWNGTLVTVIMMVLNFATEFFWDKFIVFNDKLINKIIKTFGNAFPHREKAKVEAIDTLEAADSNKKDNIIYSDAKVEILEEDAKD